MTEFVKRAYTFTAFPPSEGLDAFEKSVELSHEFWSELSSIESTFIEALSHLKSIYPKGAWK